MAKYIIFFDTGGSAHACEIRAYSSPVITVCGPGGLRYFEQAPCFRCTHEVFSNLVIPFGKYRVSYGGTERIFIVEHFGGTNSVVGRFQADY